MTSHHQQFHHEFHPSILRAYDIRGIVGTTLFAQDAFAIGLGFAQIAAQRQAKNTPKIAPIIAVGYDGRISSPELAEALGKGLIAGGAHVVSIGMGPTPMLYFADRELACDGAIQITGSHNPKDYNGFKMVIGHRSFYGDDITALGQMMAEGVTISDAGTQEQIDVMDDYIARLVQDAITPHSDDSAVRDATFVWDTGNGAAGPAVRALIGKLAGAHALLFEEVDGTFPNHHPDPVDPHTLAFLKQACDEAGALCGLGFDGDGDRLGVIDAKGRQVPGDMLTAFLALEFLSRHQGEVVLFDVKSSAVAMALVKQAGGKPEIWKTGHSHMKSRMAEIGCELAGEMSGHIFIKDGYYGFDDALYVAVRVLRTMVATGQTITQFMDDLPPSYTSPECRVPCDDDIKFSVMAALADTAQSQADAKQTDVLVIDGIRVQDDQGWWLIRASNTEACLVVRAEGVNEAALEQKISELQALLASQNIHWTYQG